MALQENKIYSRESCEQCPGQVFHIFGKVIDTRSTSRKFEAYVISDSRMLGEASLRLTGLKVLEKPMEIKCNSCRKFSYEVDEV